MKDASGGVLDLREVDAVQRLPQKVEGIEGRAVDVSAAIIIMVLG